MRRTYLVLVFIVTLASCVRNADEVAPESAATVEDQATTTIAPTTTAPEPSSTEAPAAPAPPTEGAAEAWVSMWQGAELLVVDPDAAQVAILDVATESVLAQLATIYNPSVDSDAVSTPRTFDCMVRVRRWRAGSRCRRVGR